LRGSRKGNITPLLDLHSARGRHFSTVIDGLGSDEGGRVSIQFDALKKSRRGKSTGGVNCREADTMGYVHVNRGGGGGVWGVVRARGKKISKLCRGKNKSIRHLPGQDGCPNCRIVNGREILGRRIDELSRYGGFIADLKKDRDLLKVAM